MKKVNFEKGKMMFFNMENFVQDVDGMMISVPSKKHLVIKLSQYCSDNGMENVDFTWNGGGNLVTIWCHHHLGDLTNVYLVGVMSKETWYECGWFENTTNPNTLHINWDKETNVFGFEEGVEKVLGK